MAPLPNTTMVLAAVAAAAELARSFGLTVEQPVLLRSTNNAVAWLRPAKVVAKVGIGRKSHLHRELQVARELVALDAPVVAPAPDLPPIVHCRGGLEMTFWEYHAQSRTTDLPADQVARALRRLHRAFGRLPPALGETLPTYMGELSYVRSLLADNTALPSVTADDRNLLIRTFDALQDRLDELVAPDRLVAIHGAPHSYNVLLVHGEPAFIDFETASRGPVEWDLAHLDSAAEAVFSDVIRPELLWLCRSMTSVKTATLCFADIDRGDMREHAEWHLAHVRAGVAQNLR